MSTRYFALGAGVVYAILAIWGFVSTPFPGGLVVNLLHLGLGVWGVMAYASRPAARSYSRGLAVAAGILAFIALLPTAPRTALWLDPTFGGFWLHALTVAIAAYFGWGRRRQTAAFERNLRKAA